MEYEKIIFFRNFFFRAFIIGVAFALFYFVATYLFWNTGVSWATHFFKIDEKEFGRLVSGLTIIGLFFAPYPPPLRCVFDGTKIASLIPCKNFLSAGAIVASAPRNFTRSPSTK